MPDKKIYAIEIDETTLDLIEFINHGVRPAFEDKPTVFIIDTDTTHEIATTIMFEDDIYDSNGKVKPEYILLKNE